MTNQRIARLVLAAGLSCLAGSAMAQSGDKYTARLGWVPTAGAADRANVTGRGTATATLAGTKLSISGTFDGLAGPATVARLHEGVAKGARGRAITDLTVSKAVNGTVTGAAELTKEQLESLKQGRLYVQIHSEKGVAPDGSNLWGWFLR